MEGFLFLWKESLMNRTRRAAGFHVGRLCRFRLQQRAKITGPLKLALPWPRQSHGERAALNNGQALP
jgi:hypothetical protein